MLELTGMWKGVNKVSSWM